MDLRGLEPLTPCMPCRCATSCATAPDLRCSVVSQEQLKYLRPAFLQIPNPAYSCRGTRSVRCRRACYSASDVAGVFATLPTDRAPTQLDWQRVSRIWRQQLEGRRRYLETLEHELRHAVQSLSGPAFDPAVSACWRRCTSSDDLWALWEFEAYSMSYLRIAEETDLFTRSAADALRRQAIAAYEQALAGPYAGYLDNVLPP